MPLVLEKGVSYGMTAGFSVNQDLRDKNIMIRDEGGKKVRGGINPLTKYCMRFTSRLKKGRGAEILWGGVGERRGGENDSRGEVVFSEDLLMQCLRWGMLKTRVRESSSN